MALQFVTRQLADGIITTAKLASNSVTPAKADLTGTWSFASGVLQAAAPSNASDVATKSYVDGVAAGIKWKQPARVTAPGNVDISTGLAAGQTVDGVTLVAGDRVLLTKQTTGSQCGVYIASASGAASRATDMDAGTEFPSAAIFVSEGTANADTGWVCTNDSVTVGTTAVVFVQFTGAAGVIAGNGLSKTGNTLDIKLNATSPALIVDGSGLTVKVKANAGIVKDSDGISVGLAANKGLEFSSGALAVKASNGVTVDGSGFVTLLLDGGTLASSGTGVKIADGGVGTTQIAGGAVTTGKLADNAVTLAKAGFRPYAESFSGGTALAYDLGQDIRSEFYPGVLVALNGQLLAKVASSPGDGEFTVDRNGGTSKTRITLGGTAPATSDTITANYLG